MYEVQYYIKRSYGRDRMFPANKLAEGLCALLGTATLNPTQDKLEKLKAILDLLQFELVEVSNEDTN